MITRLLTALTLALTLGFVATPAALACGDKTQEAAKPVPADAQTATVKITGMTCDGCANQVRNALLKVDGVYDAEVNWESGVATVKFDGSKVDQAKLGAAITKAGYGTEAPQKS